jgi:L-aminopeptidase/D-esterase-like protein
VTRARFLAGYRIGHATDFQRKTGCTVILPPEGTIAAVDIRGGAPGTRETGVFTPGNLVSEIHALLFTGGSAFGLAAATGVMAYLRRRGAGFAVGEARVPIVAGAVLFDLAVGDPSAFPDEEMGEAACDAAVEEDVETGAVGAGTGATAGKLFGIERAARGGLGIAVIDFVGGGTVAALAVANPFGDVVDSETGRLLAAPSDGRGGRVRSALTLLEADAAPPSPGGNTTLVCVATNVPFDTGALKRVAIEAHDGIARAVRPAHTVVDGDVAFALAPSGPTPPLSVRLKVGAAAAQAVARAIGSAVETR